MGNYSSGEGEEISRSQKSSRENQEVCSDEEEVSDG